MRVEPLPEFEVISLTPAITPRRRSSGVATLLAMVSGLAPGKDADTEIAGKSTCGSGETGSTKKAAIPASASPSVSRTVAIGRWTKGFDRFMRPPLSVSTAPFRSSGARCGRMPGRSPAW